MSFLTRTLRVAPRTTAAFAPRAFSTSFVAHKSATETVKDAAKTVDKTISSKIVDGIEAGETVAQKAKQATGMSAEEIKGKSSEVLGEGKGKANEIGGELKGKANELSGAAKGKKEEVKGKL